MNQIINTILSKLNKYPDLKIDKGEDFITISPSDSTGFQVQLAVHGSMYTVSFNGWHEEFEDSEKAIQCFGFGLSDSCRLKVYLRGKQEYKWEVENNVNNEWITDSVTGLIFSPFWKRKSIKYLQNKIIKKL